jgi:hypothetical protein
MRRPFLLLLVALLTVGSAQAAPSVTLTAVPALTTAPSSVTVTWATQEVATCTASGGWTGTKSGTGGTEVINNVLGTTAYAIACSSATGEAPLNWSPPVQNVDGSPLTDLAGFKVVHATSQTGLGTATPVVIADPLATAYTLTALPAGIRYFGVRAFNQAGAESTIATVSKGIVTSTVNASATATLLPRPKPPTNIVVNVLAFEFKVGQPLRLVGTVPLGTECLALRTSNLYEVPRGAVTPSLPPGRFKKVDTIVAQCAEA